MALHPGINALPMETPSPRNKAALSQQGFTLLELLVVITILSTVAWMAIDAVEVDSNQVRFEDTRNRLAVIRRAIIGDVSRTLNGSPEIRGYVADMGGLPTELNALTAQDYCKGQPTVTSQAECTTGVWTTQPAYKIDDSTNNTSLRAGWNGPYIPSINLSNSGSKFLDGWGNDDGSSNFGWIYPDMSGVTPPVDLAIHSKGLDNAVGGTSVYELDYPQSGNLIYENEYSVLITNEGPTSDAGDGNGGLAVNFRIPSPCWNCNTDSANNRIACSGTWSPAPLNCSQSGDSWLPSITTPGPEELCLKVAYRKDGAIHLLPSVSNDENPSSAKHTYYWNGKHQTITFIFPDGTKLPQGQLGYKVFEKTAGSSCSDSTNSFPDSSAEWRYFTLVPGVVMQPLEWNVE